MNEKTTKITDVLALLVFAIFAVCVLLVLLGGAKVYRQVVAQGEAQFEKRTAAQYVTMRVRQAEAVTVDTFGEGDALVIAEKLDGETYLTRVYCCDGYLRELYCAEDAALLPRDGEKILPADSLKLSLTGDLLTVQIDAQTLYLCLSGREAAP